MSSVLEYTLPRGWKEDRLENLIAIGSSITYGVVQPGPEDEQGVPFVRGGDIYNGKIAVDKLRTISQDVSKTYKRTLLEGGELLMSLVGYPGEVAIVPSELVGANIARQAAYIKLDEKNDNKYLMYYLLSEIGKFFLFQKSTGSAQQVINLVELKEVNIILPLLAQQQKIAKVLSTVDNLIEKTQTLIEKYTAIKQGMMADLFTRGIDMTAGDTPNSKGGKLRPSVEDAPELYKQTELGWVPKEWEVVSIDESGLELLDGDRGGNYPSQDEFSGQGYCLFLSAKNVTKKGFNWSSKQFISNEKHKALGGGEVLKGDIVITTRGTVGNIAYYDNPLSFSAVRVNSGMLILRNNSNELDSKYIFNLYSEYLFSSELERVVSGSAQPQLPSRDLKTFRLIKPSLNEQVHINEIVDKPNKLIQKYELELSKLTEIKKGLMQDLLTGKVRVQ